MFTQADIYWLLIMGTATLIMIAPCASREHVEMFVIVSGAAIWVRVAWFKSFDLNHSFKSWFKSLQKYIFFFINILSIIINILLIFNDKFDFFKKIYLVCVFIILQSCETIITCIENYIIIS